MAHPKEEKTLIILKPDAVHRGLMGEIIGRFEKKMIKGGDKGDKPFKAQPRGFSAGFRAVGADAGVGVYFVT